MCTAVTYVPMVSASSGIPMSIPSPCAQTEYVDSYKGLCYYHHKMSEGLLEPNVSDAVVKLKSGETIFTPSAKRNKRG